MHASCVASSILLVCQHVCIGGVCACAGAEMHEQDGILDPAAQQVQPHRRLLLVSSVWFHPDAHGLWGYLAHRCVRPHRAAPSLPAGLWCRGRLFRPCLPVQRTPHASRIVVCSVSTVGFCPYTEEPTKASRMKASLLTAVLKRKETADRKMREMHTSLRRGGRPSAGIIRMLQTSVHLRLCVHQCVVGGVGCGSVEKLRLWAYFGFLRFCVRVFYVLILQLI